MTAFTITSVSASDLAAMDAAYEAAGRAISHRVPGGRLDAYRDFLGPGRHRKRHAAQARVRGGAGCAGCVPAAQ
jgi:hypothetical protein